MPDWGRGLTRRVTKLSQQRLGPFKMLTSLRVAGCMPAEFLVCERGLERHAKPLNGG
jgi:hypothetical protein